MDFVGAVPKGGPLFSFVVLTSQYNGVMIDSVNEFD
jgi:hypothetical protein